MIKILHIHTLPIISGSGINTFLSMKGMDRDIYHVELACAPGGRLIDLVKENGMEVRTFRRLVQPLSPVNDFFTLFAVTLFLIRNRYHIVHTHNSKAGFIGRMAAKLAGVPVIIHTVHGFAFHRQESALRRFLFKNLERTASRWCDKAIFISQPLIEWALEEKIIKEEKIVKIYSGINLDDFKPPTDDEKRMTRKKWGIGEHDPVIGIVSKLWEGKGHSVLLNAVKELKQDIPDVKLVIVGEGDILNSLEKEAERLGLKDSVVFTGFQMNVSELIATFDVAVLPSFFEGMGRVILEAMAMEKPVVASRVGGIPDLVEPGKNGILTTPGNVLELSGALKKILQDKNLALKMGLEGRKRIRSEFSSEVMVKSINKIYQECLKKKGIQIERRHYNTIV
ncbi:MAG: glycosyltransferase family 4 protein [Deltaproteobacteria bacterium]|nr:glycosyltransferase family 4 protein [Deltaproteobacteria bacterium]